MAEGIKIVLTEDGSHTLSVPSLDEHYHSVHGAISESEHIFINAGLRYILQDKPKINILEIGFGTGLNALLTLREITEKRIPCEYTAIEISPLEEKIFSELNYPTLLGIQKNILLSLHQCRWDEKEKINDSFTLNKIHSSIHELSLPSEKFDLVYFDAFGPDKQPGMWTEDVFMKIFSSIKNGGIMTTYSTKGDVKRNLKAAGFSIEKLPGPKGKREILRAKK